MKLSQGVHCAPIARISRDGREQPLMQHLASVGRDAASKMPGPLAPLGLASGLLHDVGKARAIWQRDRLRLNVAGIVHAIHGGAIALGRYGRRSPAAIAVGMAVAAHHGGLRDRCSAGLDGEARADGLDEVAAFVDREVAALLPDADALPSVLIGARSAVWVRLLLAALVDADRCDAAAFDGWEVSGDRARVSFTPVAFAGDGPKDRVRSEFRAAVVSRARDRGPWFRVTGPCGVGKTYALAEFAARRCDAGLATGVLYVGPLKAIVTQTAGLFREWFGDRAVLEHHADVEPPTDRTAAARLGLAMERWDAPVIVTTAVQFFESLFAARAGKVRKLAGVRDRVLIFDEIQTLPPQYARSALAALATLATDYGCTIVAASATNPSFAAVDPAKGVDPVWRDSVEVASPNDRGRWFRAMATARWRLAGEMDWAAIAGELAADGLRRALVIVNTTAIAAAASDAFEAMGLPVIHLSGRMCPAHKADVLAQIRAGEMAGTPAIVVATQVVEAGADIDFPRVYSQAAPLDSLMQRAGRCDRNGRRPGSIFCVFEVPGATAAPYLSSQMAATRRALAAIDPNDPAQLLGAIERYFARARFDEADAIHDLERGWQFAEVARRARWIEDNREPAVVPYGEIDLDALGRIEVDRAAARSLQRLMVPIPKAWERDVEVCGNGLRLWRGGYGDRGICVGDVAFIA